MCKMVTMQSENATVNHLRAVDTLGAPPAAIPDAYAYLSELQVTSLPKEGSAESSKDRPLPQGSAAGKETG